MPNRLAHESSPYLRQHAGNPVDWYPWGEEAFARARREDKPIFLSIGYSTCHWCHVMEHESFESEAVAAALNADFVAIKVDREERPDVDRVYMLFVQATTGAGGWPMSVWLTPDLQPFHGGTYFPPASRWGRPGFLDVLREVARAWREDRARVTESAAMLTERLREIGERGPAPAGATADAAVPGPDALARAADEYRRAFDRRHGGFGGAPKFPRPVELLFLLREHARTGQDDLRDLVAQTLTAMSLGGLRDHVGGGFHRYSVDAAWRVPHFEKMLYDQAQLVLTLLETSQATGDTAYALVAADTLAYLRRDLRDSEGGFYSAEDADSLPPESAGAPDARKSEGAFYLWRLDEVQNLLGADAAVAIERFDIRAGGNAPHDPQGEFGTKNLLYVATSVDRVAEATGRPAGEVVAALARARERMLEARAARPRPSLDDKVLTAWNGLAIGAFARAARVLPGVDDVPAETARRALEDAQAAASFLRRHAWNEETGRLLRRVRGGDAAIDAFCEDYAFLALGLLELFQADGDPQWLAWALRLQETQHARFWDEASGGWFSTTGEDRSVLLRMKEDHDGAEPSATSVSVLNALLTEHLVGGGRHVERARRALAHAADRLDTQGRAVPLLLAGLAFWHAAPAQVVVVGHPADDATRALRRVVARHYRPWVIEVPVTPGASQARLAEHLPYIGAMQPRCGRPTAFVCRNFVCLEPVVTPDDLERQLLEVRV
jgi:hypothetical protein